ncbi:MAG: hypothetical protein ACRD1C_00990 [Terriglobales bacterium]
MILIAGVPKIDIELERFDRRNLLDTEAVSDAIIAREATDLPERVEKISPLPGRKRFPRPTVPVGGDLLSKSLNCARRGKLEDGSVLWTGRGASFPFVDNSRTEPLDQIMIEFGASVFKFQDD